MSIERAELEQRISESTSAMSAIALCSFKDNEVAKSRASVALTARATGNQSDLILAPVHPE